MPPAAQHPASPVTATLRRWLLPGALALAALITWLGGEAATALLRYEREAILAGELHRLLTAHFAHLGRAHLALNLAGLGLVWALVGRQAGAVGWLAIVASSLLGVSLGLLAFSPGIVWYVGLSGMLHGMLVAGALRAGRAGLPILLVVAAKLAWEQLAGPGEASWLGGATIVDAHLYGAIGGLLGAAALRWPRR